MRPTSPKSPTTNGYGIAAGTARNLQHEADGQREPEDGGNAFDGSSQLPCEGQAPDTDSPAGTVARSSAEDELRRSEERFNLAARAANDCIWDWDLATGAFYISERITEILGLVNTEVKVDAREWRKRIHPDDFITLSTAIQAHVNATAPEYEVEYRLRHEDGSWRWVLARGQVLRDESDVGYRMVGSLTDVTQRKASEEALREREARLRLLTDHMPAILWTLDQNFVVTSVRGGRPLQTLQVDPATFIGRNLMDILGIRDRSVHPMPLVARALAGEVVTYEMEWLDRTFRVSLEPLRRSDDDALECIGVNFDVTDQKRAEQALRESERRYRAVVEDQTELVCRWKPDTTLTFVNQQYARAFDKRPEELIGTPLLSLVPDEDRQEVRQHLAELLAAMSPRSPSPMQMYEQRVLDANQNFRYWQWTERGIFDEEGRLVEIQSVGRDVTARRQAEAQIRQHQSQLAQVARARTLGETAAGLAHELNQPLAAVINFARGCMHRLRAGKTSEQDLIDAMSQVVVQAERAAEIVRGLRRFMVSTDALRVWIGLNDFIRESLPYVDTEARRYGVSIKTRLAAQTPRVQIDRVQLEQVILNLVRNGAEAMRADGGELIIETSALEDGSVEVAVLDTGVGIPVDDAHRIFEPFFTTKPDGLGIGLALSRSIVEAHGGRLWATPNSEGGMTFRFMLPSSDGMERNNA